jgi:hypothetical protein
MRPAMLLLSCIILGTVTPSQAQLLKKIKDKVNKTINNTTDSDSKSDESSSNNESSTNKASSSSQPSRNDNSAKWCDTVKTDVVGADGVQYTLAYSSPNRIDILYDESVIGLANDAKGYRMILSERVNNKTQYTVVENGKVINTDTKVNPEYILKSRTKKKEDDGTSNNNEPLSKYIIGDTLKNTVAATGAKSVTVKKVDDDQFAMAMELAKQSDDYKNMSEEEKKEFEESFRKAKEANGAMAGKTIDIPAQQGGTYAAVTGYYVVIKGKKYGKFQMPPAVEVSADETKFFAVGISENAEPIMYINGKKTALDKNKFAGISGKIIHSPDDKKFAYVEQKKMSDKELEEFTKSVEAMSRPLPYNVIRPDGSTSTVTDYDQSGEFRLTNSGVIVNMNEQTGEVYGDGKRIGKFSMQGNDRLNSDALLIGNDISQVAYYNGSEGSFTYLDGTTRKLNIMFPKVIFEGGKSYLTWFRKCGNKIFIARFAY